MPALADHFSGHAEAYAAYRPGYPAALVEALAAASPARERAWDVGCGSGQLSVQLAAAFREVVATDAFERPIREARPHPRVAYRVAPAEASGLPAASCDLLVAAQAAHWFDLPAFYAEARRVARSGALLALVTYGLHQVDPDLDEVVRRFYGETVGAYWPPERRHIEDGYASLPFPFPAVALPPCAMSARWTLPELLGYVRTWSATQRAVKVLGEPVLRPFEAEMTRGWGDPAARREVRWPLAVRAGRL